MAFIDFAVTKERPKSIVVDLAICLASSECAVAQLACVLGFDDDLGSICSWVLQAAESCTDPSRIGCAGRDCHLRGARSAAGQVHAQCRCLVSCRLHVAHSIGLESRYSSAAYRG